MNPPDTAPLPPAAPIAPDDATPAEQLGPVLPAPFEDVPKVEAPAAPVNRVEAMQAVPFLWEGVELHPFTEHREDLWCLLREADGAPDWSSLIDIAGRQNQRVLRPDACRVLWLCRHTPADWRVLQRDYAAWNETIATWAEDHVSGETWVSAIELMLDILQRKRALRAVPRASAPPALGE